MKSEPRKDGPQAREKGGRARVDRWMMKERAWVRIVPLGLCLHCGLGTIAHNAHHGASKCAHIVSAGTISLTRHPPGRTMRNPHN